MYLEAFALVGSLAGLAIVGYYLLGPVLLTRLGGASPAPGWLAERLPAGSPPALVVQGEGTGVGGAGPPGFRRLVLSEGLLEESETTLHSVGAMALAAFETHAFDASILSVLFRVEASLFLVALLLQSARVDRSPVVVAAIVLVTLLLAHAVTVLVRRRYYRADERAAEQVGRDAVVDRLESRDPNVPGWLPDVLRFAPSPERRLARVRGSSGGG